MKELTKADLLKKARTSEALTMQSKRSGKFAYPAQWEGKVPLIVRMTKAVFSDIPGVKLCAENKREFYVKVNSYGAVTALLYEGGELGLTPNEFEVVHFHKTETELATLKSKWRHDPCWDLEESAGFEPYFEELSQYKIEQKSIWQENHDERIKTYSSKMGLHPDNIGEEEYFKFKKLIEYVMELDDRLFKMENKDT